MVFERFAFNRLMNLREQWLQRILPVLGRFAAESEDRLWMITQTLPEQITELTAPIAFVAACGELK